MLGLSLQETRVYQEAKAEGERIGEQRGIERGIEQGIERGERSLLSLQLEQKLGKLSSSSSDRIAQLNASQLEALAIALLNFSTSADLEIWLEHNG